MSFNVGTLVKARGREWVVLPESQDDFLIVRPLGGTDAEVAGIDTALESVEPASFDLPNPERLGDFQSCRLLRDAIRLGFRSSAGPFRSFGKIAVEPRPYQLVPLLMALKLDPALPTLLKRVVVMGGAVTGRGNAPNVSTEFNIFADPEAAQVVFTAWETAGRQIELVDWEVTTRHGIHATISQTPLNGNMKMRSRETRTTSMPLFATRTCPPTRRRLIPR